MIAQWAELRRVRFGGAGFVMEDWGLCWGLCGCCIHFINGDRCLNGGCYVNGGLKCFTCMEEISNLC